MKVYARFESGMKDFRLPALVLVTAVLTAAATGAPFDYYVLSLSWAPAFCAQRNAAARNEQECAAGKRIGFIVHGLWPEDENGRGPESCGAARGVPGSVVKFTLPYMLSASLMRHEWAEHGVCTGLNVYAFFMDLVQARTSIQIPVQLTTIESPLTESPGQIEEQFAGANPSFPMAAFRTYCSGRTFREERVCFDKNLKPRACTASVEECRSAELTIPPPL